MLAASLFLYRLPSLGPPVRPSGIVRFVVRSGGLALYGPIGHNSRRSQANGVESKAARPSVSTGPRSALENTHWLRTLNLTSRPRADQDQRSRDSGWMRETSAAKRSRLASCSFRICCNVMRSFCA